MIDESQITYFAETDSRNRRVRFGIKASDRTRHMYVIGKTGMGKSTLLENLAIQDIRNGHGIAIIDPHGSFADKMLEYVPEHRIKDVLYFAPFDMDHPISFNVMEDVGVDKRHLVASGLLSAFKKIWVDAWSARMEYILNNAILALLEYPDSTLISVNRMLSDKEYRKKVVDYITDPSVKSFWTDEFANYTERMAAEATPAIQNKIGQFISNPVIRNIIGQPKSSFDVRDMMDKQKIMIVNLSKGRVGEANANLLGSMLVTKIYLGAMSRADLPPEAMKSAPNFYLFVDEFQTFANESFADILSEARKYKLNLTIAHQYIEQMPEEVRSAVFGNVGTMITFRVGAIDAEVLQKEFSPQFTATDLVNLGFAQIYLKLMIDGVSSMPFSASTMAPLPREGDSFRERVIEQSRLTYSQSREKVEDDIKNWHKEGSAAEKKELRDKEKAAGGGGDFKKPAAGAPAKPWQRKEENYRPNKPLGATPAAPTQVSAPAVTPVAPAPVPRRDQPVVERGNQSQNHSPKLPTRPSDSRPPQRPKDAPPPVHGEGFVGLDMLRSAQQSHRIPDKKREDQTRRELELREAVSLSSLQKPKDEREKKKELSTDSVSALRAALGAVLAEKAPAAPVPAPVVTPTPVVSQPVAQMPLETPPPAPVPVQAPVHATAASQAQPAQQPPVAERPPQSPQPQTPVVPQEIPADVLERTLRLDEDPPKA